MQPVFAYRPEAYPPRGRIWPQFGDDVLEETLSLSEGATQNLQRKKEGMMGDFHKENMIHHGLAPRPADVPVPDDDPPGYPPDVPRPPSDGPLADLPQYTEPPPDPPRKPRAHFGQNYLRPRVQDSSGPPSYPGFGPSPGGPRGAYPRPWCPSTRTLQWDPPNITLEGTTQ